ncbi:hypothetical protein ACTXG6_42825 [Pseudonocardia sp. Cha107L01]|uniref:hypothetical protein n=1 Tax=Pseudonocardia sp. Cha107L01 TaxID=3457576 RepID=UPI00403ED93F
MDFDETVAVSEVRVLPPRQFGRQSPASPWVLRPRGRRFDEPADRVDGGPRQLADNVVLGYD